MSEDEAKALFAKVGGGEATVDAVKFAQAWLPKPFTFGSGLPDCCAANPDLYKTIAEIPGVARLVEMCFRTPACGSNPRRTNRP